MPTVRRRDTSSANSAGTPHHSNRAQGTTTDVNEPLLNSRIIANNPDVEASRSEVVSAFTVQLQREEERNEEREAVYRVHCSRSAYLALLIWCTIIGLVVWRGGGLAQLRAGDAGDVLLEGASGEVPEGCRGAHCLKDGGSEAFGTILGVHNGVLAFSNCYSQSCISMLSHSISVLQKGGDGREVDMTTGMKWQCVEYARRYWMMAGKPVKARFGDVDGATDIWEQLSHAELMDGSTTPLIKHLNGATASLGGRRPRVGDLVIYPRDGDNGDVPYGHVAVVVGVELGKDNSQVFLAEQNWVSRRWPGPHHNYSRAIPLRVEGKGPQRSYTMEDVLPIVGWVRYARYDDDDDL